MASQKFDLTIDGSTQTLYNKDAVDTVFFRKANRVQRTGSSYAGYNTEQTLGSQGNARIITNVYDNDASRLVSTEVGQTVLAVILTASNGLSGATHNLILNADDLTLTGPTRATLTSSSIPTKGDIDGILANYMFSFKQVTNPGGNGFRTISNVQELGTANQNGPTQQVLQVRNDASNTRSQVIMDGNTPSLQLAVQDIANSLSQQIYVAKDDVRIPSAIDRTTLNFTSVVTKGDCDNLYVPKEATGTSSYGNIPMTTRIQNTGTRINQYAYLGDPNDGHYAFNTLYSPAQGILTAVMACFRNATSQQCYLTIDHASCTLNGVGTYSAVGSNHVMVKSHVQSAIADALKSSTTVVSTGNNMDASALPYYRKLNVIGRNVDLEVYFTTTGTIPAGQDILTWGASAIFKHVGRMTGLLIRDDGMTRTWFKDPNDGTAQNVVRLGVAADITSGNWYLNIHYVADV